MREPTPLLPGTALGNLPITLHREPAAGQRRRLRKLGQAA
jgi:hypothetical protein